MKVAILETVKASAGFELEFDRIIIEALRECGHNPVMMLPEGAKLDYDFDVPKYYLSGGGIISYDGVKGLKKIWYSYLREKRRVKWFDAAVGMAKEKGIDAIVLTTATYRYMRALKKSRLRNIDIPVFFIFLGVNPQEKPRFLSKANDCLPYKNIHLCVTTLRDDFGENRPRNVKLIKPPVMIPKKCQCQAEHNPLRIGFFGHYRKGEKNIDWLLRLANEAVFNRPVKFVIQLVPTTEEDRREVEQIVAGYKENQVEFITHKLLNDDWYNAIQSVDIVYLPYTAERYLYNWSAIYFTAIGAKKPVLTTNVLNPEVMKKYSIGAYIDVNDFSLFRHEMETFVDGYEKEKNKYALELEKANMEYGKMTFINNLLKNDT
ncbi:hypothetical protein SAMN04487861_11238 [Selenomonas ruminantium]|jgi:glycosyltransferase involved in cell wall biosynthesis|uniref:Uncharacterized protein n=1 Tax=Selenomonas ruminantium TaxID=971 RepID=A0A1I3EZ21_SELRU|nr:glycosyltransferase [Selenomonas ruminantium]MBE6075294.1 glycosyltransferase family 1 protein [Selenomonas ruminantium]SFI04167.1 hypothetical protein SAMN04487861_11238 [Selenomonas ruminantium]